MSRRLTLAFTAAMLGACGDAAPGMGAADTAPDMLFPDTVPYSDAISNPDVSSPDIPADLDAPDADRDLLADTTAPTDISNTDMPDGDVSGAGDAAATSDATPEPDTAPDTDTTAPSEPARLHLIDAAISWDPSRVYFFRGAEYIRYDMATDHADAGYPLPIAAHWPGVFPSDIDAAVAIDGKIHFFRGGQYTRYDIAADRADPGFPVPIADAWPGVFTSDIDAALLWKNRRIRFVKGASFVDWSLDEQRVDPPGVRALATDWPGVFLTGVDAAVSLLPTKNYLFSERDYLREDWSKDRPDAGYPLQTSCWWPGLWDPYSGTGHPGPNLPDAVRDLLRESPSPEEIAARQARVAASIADGYVDRSPDYPLYLASVEARLGAWGCLLLEDPSTGVWRYRCASDRAGVRALDLAPWRVKYIDWASAAYHVEQVSQGDFLADPGTPLTILRSDDGTFHIVDILTDPPTGSISGGVRVQAAFMTGGVEKTFQFSHLNTALPQYVVDARRDGTPLPTGTVFGFVGYTGNLWIAAPPAVDGPYTGTGAGLPQAHTHVWFVDQLENHEHLASFAREALGWCGSYPYGGD